MSYWISVGPKPNDWCPYKKVLQRCRHARRPSCEDRGGDWSDVAAKSRTASNPQKLGEKLGTGSSLSLWWRDVALVTL